MRIPSDWNLEFSDVNVARAAIGTCAHCGRASTFYVIAQSMRRSVANSNRSEFYLVIQCNSVLCREITYIVTTKQNGFMVQDKQDSFDQYPKGTSAPSHESIPADIGADWLEARISYTNGAIKAAAVMCRRVLYGCLLEKGCKLQPLQSGITELCNKERMPRIVEEWLTEIKNDGHDGAHPDRALLVSAENISETMEYTSDLLRFLYVEPFELKKRLGRQAPVSS
jgi:hypothetical protein